MPLTARPHLSVATSPRFFFLFFPVFPFLHLTRGHRRGKDTAVRLCPPLRMASTRRDRDRAIHPTHHPL
jgi:hypothetical protein